LSGCFRFHLLAAGNEFKENIVITIDYKLTIMTILVL